MDSSSYGKQANELIEAQAHVLNHQYSFISSMSLKCAIQLGIPDIIHNHRMPITLQDLAASLSIKPERIPFLHRLMRLLTQFGYFSEQETGNNNYQNDEGLEKGYVLTTSSKLLLKDTPFSVAPYLLSMLDPDVMKPWHCLSNWLKNGNETDPFIAANGMAIWEYASSNPEFNKNFNDGMAGDSCLVANLLVTEEWKGVFEGLESLVDVGGGTGELAKAIACAYPHIQCKVLDLAHVVDGLEGTGNLSYVAGDMFKAVPPADAVVLKRLLHDWNDEECVQILKQCRRAITGKDKGGKVMIIEIVLGDQNRDARSQEMQVYYDMLMMALVTGKERTEKEWQKLLMAAGFGNYKITPMPGFRSLIEVYP